MDVPLPYTIACLCVLRDAQRRVLLIHRLKQPNRDLYSPIGGKLDIALGESPAQCARREIEEEAGIDVPIDQLRLAGIVSERAFQGAGHWLMFIYESVAPVDVEEREIREGRLEWRGLDEVETLPLPETDAKVIWPLLREHQGGFFSAHIDCAGPELRWSVEDSIKPPKER